MFTTRWRWVAGVSLALPRFRGGRKVPPQLARMDAEDLIGAVFPDQIACAENLVGEREIPDHPLVRQTIDDCLDRGDGYRRASSGCCAALESGAIRVVARDLTEPSPLALEVPVGAALRLPRRCAAGGAPHPGGDGAGAGSLPRPPPRSAGSMPRRSRGCAPRPGPMPANADELHDALVWLGFLTGDEVDARAGLDRVARRARARQARNAPDPAASDALDHRRAAGAIPGALARGAARPAIAPPANDAARPGRRRRRWSRFCAAGSKDWGP